MSKGFLIILLIVWSTGWVLWYMIKTNITPISDQIDLKSGSTSINWITGSREYCEWDCRNYTSSSSSSSSWWGWSSWGWWGK